MTLDEIEKLARDVADWRDIDTGEPEWAREERIRLAKALRLVMPVVRAAERMRNAGQVCEAMTADDPGRGRKQAAYSDGCFAVERAIDTMRAALGKEMK